MSERTSPNVEVIGLAPGGNASWSYNVEVRAFNTIGDELRMNSRGRLLGAGSPPVFEVTGRVFSPRRAGKGNEATHTGARAQEAVAVHCVRLRHPNRKGMDLLSHRVLPRDLRLHCESYRGLR